MSTNDRTVLSLILGGGRGSRLFPLTRARAKPAVPVAGKYRLIDIPISNCINSGLRSIYVLTQFLSVSLHRHIANTYKFDMFGKGFVEILAAQQANEEHIGWYQGTADAVRQNLQYIEREESDEILILSGDQLYRMDYRAMIETHRKSGADVTIAAIPVHESQTSGFGLMVVDDEGKVQRFVEKPKTAEARQPCVVPGEWIDAQGIPSGGRNYLANMGIYLFNTPKLIEMLNTPVLDTLHNQMRPPHDFGHNVFPPTTWARSTSRRTCSTASGRTWAPSRATTRSASPWATWTRRSTSSPWTRPSTPACGTCRPAGSTGPPSSTAW
jgi:glucose-1-phosphate adenylyltransferase